MVCVFVCQMEWLDEQTETVCQMYKLIDSYSVPSPPEDLAVYATLKPSVTGIRNAIDKALGEKDANVDKFCVHLQRDITDLNKEVKRVKQQAQVSRGQGSTFRCIVSH